MNTGELGNTLYLLGMKADILQDPTVDTDTAQDEEQISRNVQALKNRLRGKGRRRGMARLESGSGRDSHASEYMISFTETIFELTSNV